MSCPETRIWTCGRCGANQVFYCPGCAQKDQEIASARSFIRTVSGILDTIQRQAEVLNRRSGDTRPAETILYELGKLKLSRVRDFLAEPDAPPAAKEPEPMPWGRLIRRSSEAETDRPDCPGCDGGCPSCRALPPNPHVNPQDQETASREPAPEPQPERDR